LDELDPLRDYLTTTYENLHKYSRMITAEDADRAMQWAGTKFYYQNLSSSHNKEIQKLELSRVPSVQRLNDTNNELAGLPRTRWFAHQKLKRTRTLLTRYKTALQAIKEDYEVQTQYRSHQLRIVAKLYQLVMTHVGDTPFKPSETDSIIKEAEPIFAGNPFAGLKAMESDTGPDSVARRHITTSSTLPKDPDDKTVDRDFRDNKGRPADRVR